MARLNILKLRAVAPVPAPAEVAPPAPSIAPICLGCAVAHIAEGYAGETLVLCGLGGWLREMPFVVSRCTDFRKRGTRAAGPVGFGC
jgi:hypothetical protein